MQNVFQNFANKLVMLFQTLFQFNNYVLPNSFDNYFTKLESIHNHNTRNKAAGSFHYHSIDAESGRKGLQYACFKACKNIPVCHKNSSFYFKKDIKTTFYTLMPSKVDLILTNWISCCVNSHKSFCSNMEIWI